MHQVQIKVAKTQVPEGLFAGRDYIIFAVFVIPQLRGDPRLLALDTAPQNSLQRVPNLVFVAIHGSTIEVPISHRCGTFHGPRNFGR